MNKNCRNILSLLMTVIIISIPINSVNSEGLSDLESEGN